MRKVRLSKTKANKFNESGQLLSFYVLSALWAISIFKDVILDNEVKIFNKLLLRRDIFDH